MKSTIQSGTRQCRECGETKDLVKGPRQIDSVGGAYYMYFDGNGRRWHGRVCADCHNNTSRIRNYRTGKYKPVDELTDCSTAKGRRCENVARRFFEARGFAVNQTRMQGPDLILDDVFTVEVKGAYPNRGKYTAHKVSPNRLTDDFVCVVFPDDSILVEDMADHLASCRLSGYRQFTEADKQHAVYVTGTEGVGPEGEG